MRTKVESDRPSASSRDAQDINTCPNCGAMMPGEMRFCRACGCRLGEGVEEYTETVRFQSAPRTARAGKSRTASVVPPLTSPGGFKDWGAAARNARGQAMRSVSTRLDKFKVGRACKRVPPWLLWIIIPIFVVSMIGGPVSISMRHRGRSSVGASGPDSYLGSHYKTANGGAFIKDITPPGSAADKAGLVGGDTITSFDGKPVKSENDLSNLLSETPVGKTVDVTFIRDGQTKTTKLTTVSEAKNDELEEAFNDRPEGQGKLGIDDDNAEVVSVPGTNISGVRLDDVSTNLPADIAGVRQEDVVIQFNETPIRTVEELVTRIHRAVPYTTINLVVMRGSERIEIPVKVGKR